MHIQIGEWIVKMYVKSLHFAHLETLVPALDRVRLFSVLQAAGKEDGHRIREEEGTTRGEERERKFRESEVDGRKGTGDR